MEYEKILSNCKYAELRIEKQKEALVKITNDEVRHSSGSSGGSCVRVLEGGAWGFASTNKPLTKELVKEMLENAKRLAKLSK